MPEPLGGAHRNPAEAAANLQRFINKSLKDLKRLKPETLLQRRYAKIRSMGSFFTEAPAEQPAPVVVEEAIAPRVEPVVQAVAEEKLVRKPAGRLAKAQIPA